MSDVQAEGKKGDGTVNHGTEIEDDVVLDVQRGFPAIRWTRVEQTVEGHFGYRTFRLTRSGSTWNCATVVGLVTPHYANSYWEAVRKAVEHCAASIEYEAACVRAML